MTSDNKPDEPKEPPKISFNLETEKKPDAPGGEPDQAKDTPSAEPRSAVSPATPPPKLRIKLPTDLTKKTEAERPESTETPDSQQDKPQPANQEKPVIKLGGGFGKVIEEADQKPSKSPSAEDKPKTPEPEAPKAEEKDEAEPHKPVIKLGGEPEKPAEDKAEAPEPEAPKAEEKDEAEPHKPVIKLGGEPEKPAEDKAEAPEPEAPKAKEQDEGEPQAEPPKPGSSAPTIGQRIKQQTIKIDDLQEESLEDLYKAALNATQRVVLDSQQKKATSQINKDGEASTQEAAAEGGKEKTSTARVDLQEMLADKKDRPESSKSKTIAISEDQGEPPASESEAPTVKLKRTPTAETEEEEEEETVIPGADKSATARIDLPPEVTSSAPPTQRKTIRIKRPEAGATGGPRKLNIARTSGGGAKPAAGKKPSAPDIKIEDTGDDVHPAFAAVALVAVLVAMVLVYVLVATLYPGVPFI